MQDPLDPHVGADASPNQTFHLPLACFHESRPPPQIGFQEFGTQRSEQLAVDPPAVLKTNFELRGMDVDVDQGWWNLQVEKADRIATREQQSPIRLAQGVLQRTVAYVPPI